MDAFENIVAQYLEGKGYWVRQSVKIDITQADKKAIGLPTMPRPEIDLVALEMKKNELLMIEVKSLLDSYGVWFEAVAGKDKDEANKRYRLFNNSTFRRVVSGKLRQDYLKRGLINNKTKILCALAAGNIHSERDASLIRQYFRRFGWKLFTPQQIKDTVRLLSNHAWEDDPVTITAKLILRN